MKSRSLWVVIGLLALLILLFIAARAHQRACWSEWATCVWVAEQPGMRKMNVIDVMGKPDDVVKADARLGFSPRHWAPAHAVQAYVYRRHFLFVRPAEDWHAVIYFNQAGEVVGSLFGHS